MKLSENQLKVGPLKMGTVKSFHVNVTNDSTGTVNVTQIGVGCGACTTASLDTNTLVAGATGKLSITFKPNSTGQNIPKTVTINYQEAGQPKSIVFTFLATVTN